MLTLDAIKVLLIWHFFTINFYFWNGSAEDFFDNVIKSNIFIIERIRWMLFNDTCLNTFRHMQKLIMVLWGFLSKKLLSWCFFCVLFSLFNLWKSENSQFSNTFYLPYLLNCMKQNYWISYNFPQSFFFPRTTLILLNISFSGLDIQTYWTTNDVFFVLIWRFVRIWILVRTFFSFLYIKYYHKFEKGLNKPNKDSEIQFQTNLI